MEPKKALSETTELKRMLTVGREATWVEEGVRRREDGHRWQCREHDGRRPSCSRAGGRGGGEKRGTTSPTPRDYSTWRGRRRGRRDRGSGKSRRA
jgi:hypothetical protein